MNTVDAAKAIQVKKVVSISLGSSRRDAGGELRLGDTLVQLERRGTDGDLAKAAELLRFYDGKVDAIGLGGTDLYIVAGTRRYEFAQSRRLLNHVTKTPVVDGSGLKNTLERSLIRRLKQEYDLDLAAKKVLLVCAVDRFGMAEALEEQHCRLWRSDLWLRGGYSGSPPENTVPAGRASCSCHYEVADQLGVPYRLSTGEKDGSSCRVL